MYKIADSGALQPAYYGGDTMINQNLATQRNISQEDVIKIERLHAVRDNLHQAIEYAFGSGSRKIVKAIADVLPSIELELQKLWKFPENINYYRYWDVQYCRCAKMDCEDNFPHGYYSVNMGCWLHGTE
jgi:hypothetical protein